MEKGKDEGLAHKLGSRPKATAPVKEFNVGASRDIVGYCKTLIETGNSEDVVSAVADLIKDRDPDALETIDSMLKRRLKANKERGKSTSVDYASGAADRVIEDCRALIKANDGDAVTRLVKALLEDADFVLVSNEQDILRKKAEEAMARKKVPNEEMPYGFRKENPPGYG
jgi:hypothetical protein